MALAMPPSPAAVERFAGRRVGLLAERAVPAPPAGETWLADGAGRWVSPDGRRVEVWEVAEVDLRAWRERAEALGQVPHALLLDGPAASPASVRDLRVLLQLLGIA